MIMIMKSNENNDNNDEIMWNNEIMKVMKKK